MSEQPASDSRKVLDFCDAATARGRTSQRKQRRLRARNERATRVPVPPATPAGEAGNVVELTRSRRLGGRRAGESRQSLQVREALTLGLMPLVVIGAIVGAIALLSAALMLISMGTYVDPITATGAGALAGAVVGFVCFAVEARRCHLIRIDTDLLRERAQGQGPADPR